PEHLALAAIGLHDTIRDRIMGAAEATAWVKVDTPEATSEAEEMAQCLLVRDVFQSPFRPITLNPAWLTPTVTSLASAAYEQRLLPSGHLEPERLAVLADALADAGCQEASIFQHLRSPGPHVRGCWVVDLLLNKE